MTKRLQFNLDAIGVCASTLCMIHCFALPFLFALLPMWDLTASDSEMRRDTQAATAANANSTGTTHVCCHAPKCGSGSSGAENATCCSTPMDYWIHVGLLATVAPVGAFAWGAGYRQHGRAEVAGLGAAGIVLLTGAVLLGVPVLGSRGEQMVTVLGSICMVSAHLWNGIPCRCCLVTAG